MSNSLLSKTLYGLLVVAISSLLLTSFNANDGIAFTVVSILFFFGYPVFGTIAARKLATLDSE